MSDFTHLHVHTEYSLLDGYSSIKPLAKAAAGMGMSSLAITDHGNLYGAIEFYEACHDVGIKPIIGVEAYVAPGKMTARGTAEREYAHVILLAQNDTGYRNLLDMVSRSWLHGFYYKPRVDRDLIAEKSEGVIALSACLASEVSAALLKDNEEAARKTVAWYREVFGDRYYLEIQNHGLSVDDKNNRGILALGKEFGIPVVATNDSHYTEKAHHEAHDLLLAVQTNSAIDDKARMRFETPEFYLKSGAQMAELFREAPGAISNTRLVAERCNLNLEFGRLNFPALDHVIPNGEPPDAFLARICRERLPGRYPHGGEKVSERLEYELSVVKQTGFASYILLVWDFVDWARRQKITCGPRGSAAGSIILYLLGIADVDPIEYGLTFERFLNPERVQMPDVDMDFADDRRDDVINYCIERYGRDHVAQIVTFGRLLPRAALRDVGRVLKVPLHEVDRVSKLIPTVPVGMRMDQALEQVNELKQLYEGDPTLRRLIDSARQLEGVARHASTHAAGVVVSGDPLVRHVPLQNVAKSEAVMTQYPQKALEQVGLLKMDFLGLANLTMLDRAVEYVRDTHGVELDLGALPPDDELTFDKLSEGETHSIFQLEGSGMTRYVRELKPRNVRHLAAMVALYRPGPMAHIPSYIARKEGREPIQYPDPSLEELLEETYGIIVYQDQVLQIVQKVAGYSLGQADILRRAMGKKEPEVMRKERERFLAGASERGYGADVAGRLWEYIEPFAGYAFNKSHAFCYAFVAFQTAYLKAHYPVEWMAAVLTTDALKPEKVVSAIGECRRMGILLLRPDINRSDARFTVEQVLHPETNEMCRGIRYGLAAVKNVGEGAVESIVLERSKNGPFKSLQDLCGRVDLRGMNKRVLESLAKCGAFDDFGPRERVLAGLDTAMSIGQQAQRAAQAGQVSMFDMGGSEETTVEVSLPEVPPIDVRDRLAWEKETLGLFLSNHPFQEAARWLQHRLTIDTSQIGPDVASESVTLGGVVSAIRRINTRSGDTMAVVTLEDLHGTVEVVIFPRLYTTTSSTWVEDAIVIVEGKVDAREDRQQVIANSVEAWAGPSAGEPPAATAGSIAVAPAADVAWTPVARSAANGSHAKGNGRPRGNGNGNGTSNGNGNGKHHAPPTELPSRLRLVVRGDDSGVQRIDSLYRLLLEDGQSTYEVIVEAAGARWRVSPPEARTKFTADLGQKLRGLLGEDAVTVEPLVSA